MIILADRDNMVALELNASLWSGLCMDALGREPGAVSTLGLSDADLLSVWATQCESPQGQRAALCRAIVQLLRFAPGGVLTVQRHLQGGDRRLWERVG